VVQAVHEEFWGAQVIDAPNGTSASKSLATEAR
jgi:hypothetical protein